MEKMRDRFELASKALIKLSELIDKDELSEVERDALIQRFEFSYELLWKCGKDYLRVQEGIDSASPRKVMRDCRVVGILSDDEVQIALKMAEDRNLTAHTYDEEFAIELVGRMKTYFNLMKVWLDRME